MEKKKVTNLRELAHALYEEVSNLIDFKALRKQMRKQIREKEIINDKRKKYDIMT